MAPITRFWTVPTPASASLMSWGFAMSKPMPLTVLPSVDATERARSASLPVMPTSPPRCARVLATSSPIPAVPPTMTLAPAISGDLEDIVDRAVGQPMPVRDRDDPVEPAVSFGGRLEGQGNPHVVGARTDLFATADGID